ncbi:MAG: peroxiredoxin [Deferribacterota bacterium]|nr:peroxiredoxin [Deferribacterota bacterium]
MNKCIGTYCLFLAILLVGLFVVDGKLFAQNSGVGSDNVNIVKVDKPAPDFTADAFHDGEFKKVSLSDYRGKWVLLHFYPRDFGIVCPTELTALAAKYNILKSLNVEVLSVSVNSVESHQEWQEKELKKMIEGGVKFPMLSDPDGSIGRLYNVYDEEGLVVMGKSIGKVDLKASFIIDPDGIVRAMDVLTPQAGRYINETIRRIKALQHNEETGEVLPDGWVPGKTTLTPSDELEGNVWKEWNPTYSTLY